MFRVGYVAFGFDDFVEELFEINKKSDKDLKNRNNACWVQLMFGRKEFNHSMNEKLKLLRSKNNGEFQTDWEVVMTASCLATLPTLLFFLLLQKFIIRGVMLAGLKG